MSILPQFLHRSVTVQCPFVAEAVSATFGLFHWIGLY